MPTKFFPLTLTTAFGLAIATTSSASALTFTGAGGSILDNSVLTTQITVTDTFDIDDVTVSLLDLTHSFIGDLRVSLTHEETGTLVSLFQNVGGGTDLNGDYRFNDDFTGDLVGLAGGGYGGEGDDTLPSGDYFPTEVGGVRSFLDDFAGELAAGIWTLAIEDTAEGDTGTLGSWQLDLTPFTRPPEPQELQFEFSGILGDDQLGSFTDFNGASFAGSYTLFADTPDLNPDPTAGLFALEDFELRLFDDFGDLAIVEFNETTQASVALSSYIITVDPATITRPPRNFSAALALASDEALNGEFITAAATCTGEVDFPDRIGLQLVFDDEVANPNVAPTFPQWAIWSVRRSICLRNLHRKGQTHSKSAQILLSALMWQR